MGKSLRKRGIALEQVPLIESMATNVTIVTFFGNVRKELEHNYNRVGDLTWFVELGLRGVESVEVQPGCVDELGLKAQRCGSRDSPCATYRGVVPVTIEQARNGEM
jgi:hypothetical protein